MTITYTGHTQTLANSDLDALVASVAAVQPATYNASMSSFNVKDVTFGAIGNNIANDTTAIQAAVTAAGVVSGSVTIPAGTYRLTSTLTIPSGVKIFGSGGLTTLNFANTGTAYAFSATGTNVELSWLTISGVYSFALFATAATNVRFTNNTVTGGTLVGPFGYLGGIHLNGCSNARIASNTFSGNGLVGSAGADIQINGLGAGLSQDIHIVDNSCTSATVWYNIICYDMSASDIRGNYCNGATGTISYNNGYGIALYRSSVAQGTMKDNIISGNRVTNCTGTGIYLQNSNASTVTGNVLWDVALTASDVGLPIAGIGLNNTQHTTVSDNTITNPGKAAISVVDQGVVGAGTLTAAAGVGTFSVSQATVLHSGDYILVAGVQYQVSGFNGTTSCVLTPTATFGAAAFTTTYLSGCIVADNTIADALNQIAIHIRGANGILVDNNTIRNSFAGIGVLNGTIAYSDWTVTNNKISGVLNQGILALNVTSSKVNNNTITGTGTHGIDMSAGGDGNEIAGNIIRDCGTSLTNTFSSITCTTTATAIYGNVLRNTGTTGTKYGISSTGAGCQVGPNVSTGHLTANLNIAAGTSVPAFAQALLLAGSAATGTQIQLGDSSAFGAVGTRNAGADTYVAQNATQSLTGDFWTQSAAGQSMLMILRLNGNVEFYKAANGTAAATFATFWGTPLVSFTAGGAVQIGASNGYFVGANQVMGARNTGWTAFTGAATKGGFDTATVTLPQLAQVVNAMLIAEFTQGSKGT